MSLTIELPAELEERLKKQAKREGKALDQHVTGLIKASFGKNSISDNTLSPTETRLKINRDSLANLREILAPLGKHPPGLT